MIRATKYGPLRMEFVSADQVHFFSYGSVEEPMEEHFAINRVGYRLNVTFNKNQETGAWTTSSSNNYIRRTDGKDKFNLDHLDKITSMCHSTLDIHLSSNEGATTLARAEVKKFAKFIQMADDTIKGHRASIEEQERSKASLMTSLIRAQDRLRSLESSHGNAA